MHLHCITEGQEKLKCLNREHRGSLVLKKMSKNEMDEVKMSRAVGFYLAMLCMKSNFGSAFTEGCD